MTPAIPAVPNSARGTAVGRTALAVSGMSLALAVFLYVIRGKVIGFDWDFLLSPWHLRQTLGASFFDILFVEGMLVAFLLLSWILRRRERAQRVLRWGFAVCAFVTLFAAMVNVEASGLLGVPVNYQWLYYSDFLTTFDANQAVADLVSFGLIASMVACEVALFAFAAVVIRGMRVVIRGRRSGGLALATLTVASWIYYSIVGPYFVDRVDYPKFANPVYAFAESLLTSDHSSLATMETPFGAEDVSTAGERKSQSAANPRPELRNIVMFVLESTPTEFVETYGGKYPVTPNLIRAQPRSLRFDNFYAHVPSTNKSLVSILCAIYPRVSFRSITREASRIKVPTIADVLQQRGYRTAMYHAADLRFQNIGGFLKGRGFDVMIDRRSMPVIEGATGSDDEKAAAAFVDWIEDESEKPFFGVFWTRATHMPYYVSQKHGDFGEKDPDFIRYLNALKDGDAALGLVLDALDKNGLAESTLVIVLGDHGEAFFRHNQKGHACGIYEENVHIPFILMNPRLYRGGVNDVLGGTVDIGPTIMDLLGIQSPETWQGRSLFSQDRSPRVYFFAPWSRRVFGMREGNRKYVYDAIRKTMEVYDVVDDPEESENIADQDPAAVEAARQRIASWVQGQIRFMKKLATQK